MSRSGVKLIEWAAITSKLLPEMKVGLPEYKAKVDECVRRMQSNPSELPKIDWAFYEKNIPIPGFVDKFKKSYESIKVPYQQDKYTEKLDEREKTLQEFGTKLRQMSATEMKTLQEIVAYYDSLKPVDQWSAEEALQEFAPAVVMVCDNEGLDYDNWLYEPTPESLKKLREILGEDFDGNARQNPEGTNNLTP